MAAQFIPEFQLSTFQYADFIGWDLNFTDTSKEISRVHFGIKEKGNSCITGDGKGINNKTGKNRWLKIQTKISNGSGGGEAAIGQTRN
jgi:hypothetical protein